MPPEHIATFDLTLAIDATSDMAVEAVDAYTRELDELTARHGFRVLERDCDVRRGERGKVLWRTP